MSASIEDRLTRALASEAHAAEPTDERWDAVVVRARAIRRRDGRRRAAAILTAAAVVIAAVVLVRLDRGDHTVTSGNEGPAVADQDLVAAVRSLILLGDAVANEAEVSLVDPRPPAAEIAAARAATDTAIAALRLPESSDSLVQGAKANLRGRIDTLADHRRLVDLRPPGRNLVEPYHFLIRAAVDATGYTGYTATTAATARQVADARAITLEGLQAVSRAVDAAAPGDDRALDTPLDVADLSPARRSTVAAALADRRFEESLRTPSPTGTVDPTRMALATERRQRLVSLALDVLTTSPGPTVTADAHLIGTLMRDLVALRAARDRELWEVLVGDEQGVITARSRVDDAITAARRSRDDLQAATAVDLDVDGWSDRALTATTAYRTTFVHGGDRRAAAAAIAELGEADGRMLVAAGDLLPDPRAWQQLLSVAAVSSYASHLTYASALALLRLAGEPVATDELVQLQELTEQDLDRFAGTTTPEQHTRWRAKADDSPVRAFLDAAIDGSDGGFPPWPEWRDRIRSSLDRANAVVAEFAR